MQELVELKDFMDEHIEPVDAVPACDSVKYCSLPAHDTAEWRKTHPAQRVVDRQGNYQFDNMGNVKFEYSPAPTVLYLLREVNGWCYLHSLSTGGCIHQLAPDKQSDLVRHTTTEGEGFQYVCGELVACHGPTVTIDDGKGVRVGRWVGDDKDQAISNGISFVGHYSNNQPCGDWDIEYPRQVGDRNVINHQNINFKLGNIPEILNPNYTKR